MYREEPCIISIQRVSTLLKDPKFRLSLFASTQAYIHTKKNRSFWGSRPTNGTAASLENWRQKSVVRYQSSYSIVFFDLATKHQVVWVPIYIISQSGCVEKNGDSVCVKGYDAIRSILVSNGLFCYFITYKMQLTLSRELGYGNLVDLLPLGRVVSITIPIQQI